MNTFTQDNFTYTFGVTAGGVLKINIIDDIEFDEWSVTINENDFFDSCSIKREYCDIYYLFNFEINGSSFGGSKSLENIMKNGFEYGEETVNECHITTRDIAIEFDTEDDELVINVNNHVKVGDYSTSFLDIMYVKCKYIGVNIPRVIQSVEKEYIGKIKSLEETIKSQEETIKQLTTQAQ